MSEYEKNNFVIEYTEYDSKYIKDFLDRFESDSKGIMQFFDLKKLGKRILIKFWNNKEKYQAFFNEKMKSYNKTVKDWETGRTTYNKIECRIDLLCYKERLKCLGHDQDRVEDLYKVLLHEWVHICTLEYNHNIRLPMWFMEGLATNLAGQYEDKELKLTASLEEVIEGKCSYYNYHLMMKYLMKKYSKDDIIKLITNKEVILNLTEEIYYQIEEKDDR